MKRVGCGTASISSSQKPVILAFVDWYLPGFHSGGPLRSLSHLIDELGDEYEFRVVTRNWDLGANSPYPDIVPGEWTRRPEAEVLYLSKDQLDLASLTERLRLVAFDVCYFNSFYSKSLTVKPMLLQRLGRIPRRPTLVAPRGEFSPGHMLLHPVKYYLSVLLARTLRLFRDVVWQSTSALETSHIRRWFPRARVVEAPNLPPRPDEFPGPEAHPRKQAGRLRVVFVSRVAPKKNLITAIRALRGLRGEVTFDIHGPVGVPEYWAACEREIESVTAATPGLSIRYRGPLGHDSLAAVLGGCDLFLLPTLGENYGHAIVEAMLAACPVLIGDQTPWHGLAERGIGWDEPATDVERLHARLQTVVDMDEDAHASMRVAARAFAENEMVDPRHVASSREMFRATLRGGDSI